jgi:hypothetical protein
VSDKPTGENPDSFSIVTVIQTEGYSLCFVKPSTATPFTSMKYGKFIARFCTDIASDFDVLRLYAFMRYLF